MGGAKRADTHLDADLTEAGTSELAGCVPHRDASRPEAIALKSSAVRSFKLLSFWFQGPGLGELLHDRPEALLMTGWR